jgi:hypothetical protein
MNPRQSDVERAHQRLLVLAGMQVFDLDLAEPIGALEDLSLGGFRLGAPKVIAVGVRKLLRVNAKGPGYQCGFEFTEACVVRLQPALNALLRKLP